VVGSLISTPHSGRSWLRPSSVTLDSGLHLASEFDGRVVPAEGTGSPRAKWHSDCHFFYLAPLAQETGRSAVKFDVRIVVGSGKITVLGAPQVKQWIKRPFESSSSSVLKKSISSCAKAWTYGRCDRCSNTSACLSNTPWPKKATSPPLLQEAISWSSQAEVKDPEITAWRRSAVPFPRCWSGQKRADHPPIVHRSPLCLQLDV
jgi:hypothetical protein